MARHEERVGRFARETVERRSRGEEHPVYDFLFTYYSQRAARLSRWSPGVGIGLEWAEDLPGHLRREPFREEDGVVFLDPADAPGALRRQAVWIGDLCSRVADQAPQLGCYGLHEWAMVYRTAPGEQRHGGTPLRLSAEALAAFVDGQELCCSHYDAFRFFTPEAAPRNATAPDFEGRLANEQPGCLHTNMDLYKWCYKLGPWCPGELLADCFLYALRARELDMRASPYDLSEWGFDPVRVETAEGRREYRRAQGVLAREAVGLRGRLGEVVGILNGEW